MKNEPLGGRLDTVPTLTWLALDLRSHTLAFVAHTYRFPFTYFILFAYQQIKPRYHDDVPP